MTRYVKNHKNGRPPPLLTGRIKLQSRGLQVCNRYGRLKEIVLVIYIQSKLEKLPEKQTNMN